MLKNTLKTFIRNIAKNKGFALINLAGLSIGLMLGVLILTYIVNEISYDKHIINSKNKYRLITKLQLPDFTFEGEVSNGGLVDHLLKDFPNVKNAAAIYPLSPKITYQEETYFEEDGGIYFAHRGIFDLFSLDFIEGEAKASFSNHFTAAISEKLAKKYFGNNSATNKILVINDKHKCKVTGVFKDQPINTHLRFDMLVSMETYKSLYNIATLENEGNQFTVYAEFEKDANLNFISKKLEKLSYSFVPEHIRSQIKAELTHYFQPIEDIYLYTDFENSEENSKISYIFIFSAIAFFIILLASINFMNLSTAQYSRRAKEIGVKKVFGSGRRRLINNFLLESILISLIALVNALVLAELLLPVFNRLVGKDLSIITSSNLLLIGGFIVLAILVGLISGSYPALFLTRFNVTNIFRGKFSKGTSAKYFRWPLVIFQFTIALVLISSTLLIYSQLNYLKNKDLGFDKEQILTIPVRGREISQSLELFRNDLQTIPEIHNIATSSDKPGLGLSYFVALNFEDESTKDHPPIPTIGIDENFIETFNLKMIEGRNFSTAYKTDSNAVIINKSLVDYLQWKEPLNKKIFEMNPETGEKIAYTVIGVLNNFHMESLHKQIGSMVFKYKERPRYLNLKIDQSKHEKVISSIKTIWDKYSPSRPIQYSFLTDDYKLQYNTEFKFAETIIYFTIFAIFIATLGMIGLISFITLSRRKEIGIRKVLGSSTSKVINLIAIDFIKMIGISILISSPIAYYAMNKWMERFAYKIDIHIGYFIGAGLLAIAIATICIVYQTYKSARKNPIEAIKYE